MSEWKYWTIWRWHLWRLKRNERAMIAHIAIIGRAYPEINRITLPSRDGGETTITINDDKDTQ